METNNQDNKNKEIENYDKCKEEESNENQNVEVESNDSQNIEVERYVYQNKEEENFDNQNIEIKSYDNKREKKMYFKHIIIIVIIASLVGGTAIGTGYQVTEHILNRISNEGSFSEKSNDEIDTTKLNSGIEVSNQLQGQLAIEEIVDSVGPSVVSITSKVSTIDFFRNQSTQEGLGSGVIFEIGEKGIMILTNQHVVENAQELTVSLKENVQANAKIVGTDVETDLAVIQISKEDIPKEIEGEIKAVEFGNSDVLKVGERAIAMGNPLGYNNTVTVGIISALERELQLADKNMKLIQTDAAINPGNSGGALLNGKGQLIGINTIKISDTQVEGIGFAIPINYAKPIIEELLDQGYISRPYLGIVAGDLDEETAKAHNLPVGVYIHEVMEFSAAQRAGLKSGDVIIEIEGEKISSMSRLTEIISSKKVGDKIQVKAVGNGNENKELTVELQEKVKK